MMNLQAAGKAMLIGCWVIYGAVFLWNAIKIQARRRADPQPEAGRKSAPGARYGMLLEALGLLCAWLPRTPEEPIWQSAQIAALALAPSSLLLGWLAIRELGVQWRIQAVVTRTHKLITTGPYAFVRHPVYTSLFGMMVATGFVIADWKAVAAAVVLYVGGTEIRIAAEETLLAERFGTDFAVYRASVPAYIPFLR
jgi:protein-S-isoprenylcysteine O-methyltransferase Ste14